MSDKPKAPPAGFDARIAAALDNLRRQRSPGENDPRVQQLTVMKGLLNDTVKFLDTAPEYIYYFVDERTGWRTYTGAKHANPHRFIYTENSKTSENYGYPGTCCVGFLRDDLNRAIQLIDFVLTGEACYAHGKLEEIKNFFGQSEYGFNSAIYTLNSLAYHASWADRNTSLYKHYGAFNKMKTELEAARPISTAIAEGIADTLWVDRHDIGSGAAAKVERGLSMVQNVRSSQKADHSGTIGSFRK